MTEHSNIIDMDSIRERVADHTAKPKAAPPSAVESAVSALNLLGYALVAADKAVELGRDAWKLCCDKAEDMGREAGLRELEAERAKGSA